MIPGPAMKYVITRITAGLVSCEPVLLLRLQPLRPVRTCKGHDGCLYRQCVAVQEGMTMLGELAILDQTANSSFLS